MKLDAAHLIALLKGCHPDAVVLCWDAETGAWAHAKVELVHDGNTRIPNTIKIGTVGHFEDERMMGFKGQTEALGAQHMEKP